MQFAGKKEAEQDKTEGVLSDPIIKKQGSIQIQRINKLRGFSKQHGVKD